MQRRQRIEWTGKPVAGRDRLRTGACASARASMGPPYATFEGAVVTSLIMLALTDAKASLVVRVGGRVSLTEGT